MTITENSLQDARAEWAVETTEGVPPSNPAWNRFSDYLADVPGWDGGPDTNEGNAVGSGDVVEITRGSEEHSLTLEYWLQRSPVDSNGNVVDPIGYPLTHDYSGEYDTHTVVFRRETTSGGNDGAGFRMYTVATGAKPLNATIPGDPGDAAPQAPELEYEAEYGRTHVIHQPSSSTTLDVTNNGSTSVDVTIENEGASTTETVTVAGGTTTTTTASFGDVDVIYIASGTPDGTINVTDGAGTDILESPLQGTSTTDPDYEIGIPPLGTGSHASAIGNDPEQFLGLNANINRGGSVISDRVHGFDFSVEVDSSTEPVVGSRNPKVDPGTRVASIDTDLAGPYESTKQINEHFRGTESDVVLTLGGTSSGGGGAADITLKNAQITDSDENTYGAGDANGIFGVTFTAQSKTGNAVSVTKT